MQSSLRDMSSSVTSRRRTGQDGEGRSDIQSDRANRMVCRNGGGAQKVWKSTNLCRPQAPQPERSQGSSSPPEETLAGAKVFSKLDANSGFWQIPLSHSSRLLTTFITPMGCYCFNKLPSGISSAQEHFQSRMSEILARSPLSDG